MRLKAFWFFNLSCCTHSRIVDACDFRYQALMILSMLLRYMGRYVQTVIGFGTCMIGQTSIYTEITYIYVCVCCYYADVNVVTVVGQQQH